MKIVLGGELVSVTEIAEPLHTNRYVTYFIIDNSLNNIGTQSILIRTQTIDKTGTSIESSCFLNERNQSQPTAQIVPGQDAILPQTLMSR